jgi:hypothetical protein
MAIASGGGWQLPATTHAFLEPMLTYMSWDWRREGAELVLTLPG